MMDEEAGRCDSNRDPNGNATQMRQTEGIDSPL
jgi:hypothetical protein